MRNMASWRENIGEMEDEKTPLLTSPEGKESLINYGSKTDSNDLPENGGDSMAIKRTLGLPTAVLLMISCCCGTGIFVSPAGVTASVGSIALTLIIWTFSGLFSMVLALCYAELGTAIPLAGGDYTYIEVILGPFPAFLCLWVMVVLVAPCACTLMGLTAGEYFSAAFGLECSTALALVVANLFMLTSAILNIYSVKWSARVASLFSMGKVVAMSIIIVAGINQLAQGNTASFENIWEGSQFSPTNIIFGIVPAFVTYGGWDVVNAMAEEMKNPKRDIPIVAVVGLICVTSVYVLINVAYFSVLTPEQFVQSSIVVSNFSETALSNFSWLAPSFVILSALGSLFNIFLMGPRWTFAGGRNGQIPVVFSYIHVKYLTPVASIILLLLLTVAFCAAGSFFNIQAVVNMLGLFVQLKVCMALVALIYMKLKRPDLQGTIKIPMVVVVASLLLLLVVTGTALYIDPLVMGFGLVLFLAGIPLYGIQYFCRTKGWFKSSDEITVALQQFLMIVPEEDKKEI